jgi:hypothetical protein
MQRIRTSRPSPALIVAVLALVAVFAGSAIAGTGASTSALTKPKVKKIARKQINKLAPGLSVANAQSATTAANGATGYGSFNPNGTVQGGALTMDNLTQSTVAPSVYCEDQAFKTVIASGGLTTGGTPAEVSAVSNETLLDPLEMIGCPANTEWVYFTYDQSGGNAQASFQAVGF